VNAPLPPVDRGIAEIGEAEYEFIRRLIYEQSRINLGAEKKVLVAARVMKRLRALKLPNFDIYCQYLRSSKGRQEAPLLVEAISTNHTQFFRESRHFDFLKNVVVPKWRAHGPGPIRVWSAAGSSGEEPYTIAIVLSEALGLKSDWRILATDISMRMLDLGRGGIYSADRLTQVPPELQRRYFQRGVGSSEGQYRVKEELRRRVDFLQLNLLQPTYPFATEFDLIFCRNVMIYFDRETQQTLIEKITPRLIGGGYLMVGHSESLNGIHHRLSVVEPAIYQKK
jgi:chemotaxis protein methyltransferase CheR